MNEADYIAQITAMAQESFALARARTPATKDSMTEADFLARITEAAQQAHAQGEAKTRTHAPAQELNRTDQQIIDELDRLSCDDPAPAVTAPGRAFRN
jgi:hypothetical protein